MKRNRDGRELHWIGVKHGIGITKEGLEEQGKSKNDKGGRDGKLRILDEERGENMLQRN